MTLTSIRLSGSLQTLIDSRLDTIERMLMGRVSRQDRLAIVKDVETQIFDILQEQGSEDPTRDDVLAALARLDPPEAYLPEASDDGDERPAMSGNPSAPRTVDARPVKPLNRDHSRNGKIGGILGIVAMILTVLSPSSYFFGIILGSEIILFGMAAGFVGLIFCTSLVGLVLACTSRFRDAWGIVGGILNPLALFYSLFVGLGLLWLVFIPMLS